MHTTIKKLKLFGVPLQTSIERRSYLGVPYVLYSVISEIESRGLGSKSLYLVSGRALAAISMIFQFDTERTPDYSEYKLKDLTLVVRRFLEMLPESLIPFCMYDKVVKIGTIKNYYERRLQVRYCVRKLPTTNYTTLKFLIGHLHVIQASEFNVITGKDLAAALATSIIQPSQCVAMVVQEVPALQHVVLMMIDEYEHIFKAQETLFGTTKNTV